MNQPSSSPPDDTVANATAAAELPDAAALAWSDAEDIDEPGRVSWRVAWGRAAGVLVVCLMAAAVVVLGWRQLSVQQRPEQPAPRAEAPARVDAPAPISEPAVAPSPPLPSTTGSVAQKMTTPPAALDPDSIYLQLLSDAGVKAPTREKAIANGRLICQQLAQAEVDRVNPSLGVERANGTVYAAIDAYCPQFEDRGGY